LTKVYTGVDDDGGQRAPSSDQDAADDTPQKQENKPETQNPPCNPSPADLKNSGEVTFKFSEGNASALATAGDAVGYFTTSKGYFGVFHTEFEGVFVGVKGFGAAYGGGSSRDLSTFSGRNYNLVGTLGPYSISDNFDPNGGEHVGQTDAVSTIGLGLGVTRSNTTLLTIGCPSPR